jgi:hypothetical protein
VKRRVDYARRRGSAAKDFADEVHSLSVDGKSKPVGGRAMGALRYTHRVPSCSNSGSGSTLIGTAPLLSDLSDQRRTWARQGASTSSRLI